MSHDQKTTEKDGGRYLFLKWDTSKGVQGSTITVTCKAKK
jgi:hypothetical protein